VAAALVGRCRFKQGVADAAAGPIRASFVMPLDGSVTGRLEVFRRACRFFALSQHPM
jgi:hypothetical protein